MQVFLHQDKPLFRWESNESFGRFAQHPFLGGSLDLPLQSFSVGFRYKSRELDQPSRRVLA